jgi:hypothetical protein
MMTRVDCGVCDPGALAERVIKNAGTGAGAMRPSRSTAGISDSGTGGMRTGETESSGGMPVSGTAARSAREGAESVGIDMFWKALRIAWTASVCSRVQVGRVGRSAGILIWW